MDRSPIDRLLELRRARSGGKHFLLYGTATIVASIGVVVPYLFTTETVERTIGTLSWALLIFFAICAGLADAKLVESMQRGRFLEDVLASGMTRQQVAEAVAMGSLRAVAPIGAVFYAVALEVLFSIHAARSFVSETALGLPILLGTVFVASHAAQMAATRKAPGLRDAARNRYLKPWNENPIVVRESVRVAASLPDSLTAFILGRFGVALGLVAGCFAVLLYVGRVDALPFVSAGLFFIFQPLRSAYTSVRSVVGERDNQTLDMLQPTPLSAREFVDGWASVGFFPRVLETLAVAPLVLLPLQSHVSPWGLVLFGICVLDLVLVIALNGYLGVLISSVAPDRQAATYLMNFWVVLYVAFGVAPIVAAPGLADPVTLLVPPFMFIGALLLCRAWTVDRITDRPELTGFSPP